MSRRSHTALRSTWPSISSTETSPSPFRLAGGSIKRGPQLAQLLGREYRGLTGWADKQHATRTNEHPDRAIPVQDVLAADTPLAMCGTRVIAVLARVRRFCCHAHGLVHRLSSLCSVRVFRASRMLPACGPVRPAYVLAYGTRMRPEPVPWDVTAPIGGRPTVNGQGSSPEPIRFAEAHFCARGSAHSLRLTPERTAKGRT